MSSRTLSDLTLLSVVIATGWLFAAVVLGCTPGDVEPDDPFGPPDDGIQQDGHVVVQGGIGGPATRGDWDSALAEPNVECGVDDIEVGDIGAEHDDQIPDSGWNAPRIPAGDRCGDDYETVLYRLTNCERQARGLEPLSCDERLVWAGRAHSSDMYDRNYFSHTAPEGTSPGERLLQRGVDWQASAENIAIAPTMALAHSSWMESEGHRRNILRREVDHMGVGVIETDRGYVMTALFVGEFR